MFAPKTEFGPVVGLVGREVLVEYEGLEAKARVVELAFLCEGVPWYWVELAGVRCLMEGPGARRARGLAC